MNATPPDRRRVELDIAATLGLVIYSLVAALGFARVFGDWQFLGDVVLVVLVGHGLSFLLRRTRVPMLAAVLLTVAAVAWTIAWLSYPTTFTAIFPTSQTWDIMWADLGLVRSQFQVAVAPVEYIGGWALLAMIGTGFVVLASDTFAFRAHARGEALVPGAVLFVFVAALGADRHRIALTLGLVAAGILAAALLRVRFAQTPRTVLGGARSPLSITLPAAAAACSAVVIGTWIVGPRLPGADADPLVDTHNDSGGVTEVVSPLVDIRSRLVNRAATELFVVRASTPSYWRVSGLPEFDGRTWGIPDRSLEDVSGALSDAPPGSTENAQEIVISALDGRLVPSAAEPVAADGDGLRWSAETSTLLRTDRPLEEGDRFAVLSAMPLFSSEQLRAATSSAPPDPIYLALPENFPDSVADAASTVTAGTPSTYDAMLALQNWFRSEFEYSLDVPSGHGTNAIEAFLRQRIGYCEQFAGTFAAMARSIGVPARVAVGFTQGTEQPDGSRSVLGKNAHAWPEVWFDGLGWVPFEPTPGRGAPGAEGYTGLAADQDDSIPAPTSDGEAVAPATPATTVPPELIPEQPSDPALTPAVPVEEAPTIRHRVEGPHTRWGLIAAMVVVPAALAALPALVRHWRRRRASADVARQVSDLWERALAAIEATGFRVDPALTPLEQARAAAPRLPIAARPLRSLAAVATTATYAPSDEIEELVQPMFATEPGPRRWCRQVERIAEDSMTMGGRIRRYFTVWK